MTFLTTYFELILFLLVLFSGIITLADTVYFSKKRMASKRPGCVIDYARSFFPVLLAVFVLRSFIVEPYRIPSGSLKPTLETGDFIIANKFIYGLRLPVWHQKMLNIKEPKTGDIMIFRFPPNPSINYIKRVIGVPGDHIEYKNKVLSINGKTMPQTLIGHAIESEPGMGSFSVEKVQENLNGVIHDIYIRADVPAVDFDVTVPEGQYFGMGDNRDASSDSRYWGFIPEANIVGEAYCIIMSWNTDTDNIRWSRIGTLIH